MSAVLRATNAATLLAPDVLQLLRVIQSQGGKVGLQALRGLDPGGKKSTMQRVNTLRAERMVKAYKPTPRDALVVEISPVGRQALQRVDGVAAADAPAPAAVVDVDQARRRRADRQARGDEPASWMREAAQDPTRPWLKPWHYDGGDLTRPPPRGVESLRAFTLPSLVNGERVERLRPPIIMASTKPDRLQDGRGRS